MIQVNLWRLRFRANLQHVVQLVDAESANSADALSVVQFAGLEPQIICSRDCRSAEAEQKLRSIKAQGPTPLFDALTYTAQFVVERHTPGTRQVVILFSDGNDTISRASAREALEAMLSSGAMLYSVNVDASGGAPRRDLSYFSKWPRPQEGAPSQPVMVSAMCCAPFSTTFAPPM